MWKKLVFIFLIVCLLVALIGCSGGNPVVPPSDEDTVDEEFEEDTTDEEFDNIIAIGDDAVDKFEEFNNSIGTEQAYQETVDFLEQQNGVKEAGIGEDGTTIWFECENGYLVGILSTEEDEKANEKGIELAFDQSKIVPSAEKALILDPGFNPVGSYKTVKINLKFLSLYGYGNVYYESGLDVSVEFMKKLYQYSVIYIITHGGFVKDNICFALSVEATTDIKNQYDYYLKNKYLAIVFIESPILKKIEPYIAITPSFIREYNAGTFPDSLICIDACHSLEDDTMAQAFIDKGAYTYCGYTDIMRFGYDAPVEFFENLISEEMNVEEAIDNLSNANNFDYYPKNHGDLYLVEEVDDETKIINTIHKLYQALSDQDWDEARSCCVYGTEVYESLNEAEEQFYWDNLDAGGTLDASYSSDNYEIVINGEYAEAYCDTTVLSIVDGEVIDEISGGVWWYLQKIGNDWKIYDGLGSWDEDEIRSVCNKLISALNNKNWNEARSYCIYGSKAYNQINGLEDDVNNCESLFGPGNLNIDVTINNVTIDGREALVSGYFSYIFTAGTYVEENSGSVTGCLEKIGDNWKVYEGIIPDF